MAEREVGRLGRLPRQRPEGLHQLAFYQSNPLPAAPAKVATPKVKDWRMLANDKYGDCTFAGAVHGQMATAALLNIKEAFPTDKQVVDTYLKFTKGKDVGAVEADVLKTWQKDGFFGGKIAGYAPSDKHDYDELRSVIASFGFAYIGVVMPAPSMEQFKKKKPWALTGTPADTNIEGGHCVILVGYDSKYAYAITWGQVQAVTWQWLQCYMEESWAIITPEVVKAGRLGNFRLEDLQADIKKL